MQLDIFEHSREVILRNAVVEALKNRSDRAAASAIAELRAECGDDSLLPTFNLLRERLSLRVEAALGPESAAEILRATERAAAAAGAVLGREAEAWLAPFWVELAASIRGLSFDPRYEVLHAAPMLLRAGKWEQACACLHDIASWRRQPAPLAWKIAATARIAGLDRLWPLLAELSWMAPQRAAALIDTLALPELTALVRAFDGDFEGEGTAADFAWFPAWLLVTHPRLARHFHEAQAGSGRPPERCARLLLHLLALERQGRHDELIAERRKLRDAHGMLFARYMRRRQAPSRRGRQ